MPHVMDIDRVRRINDGILRSASITTISGYTCTGDGCNNARQVYFSDTLVILIRDVEIPGPVSADAGWRVQLGRGGLDVVSVVAKRARSGHGRNNSRGVDFSNPIVAFVTATVNRNYTVHRVESKVSLNPVSVKSGPAY
jgi:hypothetical protein